MAYNKPVFGALSMESEQNGCCFFFTNSGQGVYVYTEGGIPPRITLPGGELPRPNQQVASIGNNGASVTPLCGTGLPATQPIVFGVPVGVTGVQGQVAVGKVPQLSVNPDQLGISILGQHISLPL